MAGFKKEERYTVIKLKHLDNDAKTALHDFLAAHKVQLLNV